MSQLYLIGSLRNPRIPEIANRLRGVGHHVFDDWYASGPECDDLWQAYEQQRGHTYEQALYGFAANHAFHYDLEHLTKADAVVLIAPAGKSSHLELGWAIGAGKPGYIFFDVIPDRWDIMVKFATRVFFRIEDLLIGIPV